MGSYGGHVLPGTFFIIFGVWYAFKFAATYLRPKNRNPTFYCCNGKIPFSLIVIEGVVKIFMVSIGILVELYYPGAPMGKLHNPDGHFIGPMNWQHATMYFYFGISGVADVISHTARGVLPPGIDRLFGGLALFIEGYLFYFHLHGRSMIDTRVHILLVLMVWPSALIAMLEALFINKRNILHLLEMLRTVTVIAQGLWFWQVAYILYPPHGDPWDPCSNVESHHMHRKDDHVEVDHHQVCDENEQAKVTMFITLFWSWHLALALAMVALIYFMVYKILKRSGSLDKRFSRSYQSLLPKQDQRIIDDDDL